jgi:superfamily II DNA or RNA helicase
LGSALDPYLDQIAEEMRTYCKGRKTVVFLPLVATSQKFVSILRSKGIRAAEVNGESVDRQEKLQAYDRGEFDVLCNSMLLTEGWDCPSVDCIVILRPTKVRGLFCQMVGRGTRLAPGKDHLLILDFLWQTERIDLCRPACLICKDELVAKKMTEALEESGAAVDLEEAEAQGERDAIAEREQKLVEQLRAMRKRKAKLVDPLQYAISVQNAEIVGWEPDLGDKPISDKQIEKLEKMGIFAGELKSAMEADLILKSLMERRAKGLATPKQIRFLEQRGFQHVGTWEFEAANKLISRISMNNWKVPYDINPSTYEPPKAEGAWW